VVLFSTLMLYFLCSYDCTSYSFYELLIYCAMQKAASCLNCKKQELSRNYSDYGFEKQYNTYHSIW
jgi:hypothetical protein